MRVIRTVAMSRLTLGLWSATVTATLLASCGAMGPIARVLVQNERHQAITLEVTGQAPITLADCTDVLLSLPATGEWTILADGRVAYSAAAWRTAEPRDRTYPVVLLQGGVEPIFVFEERGIPEASGVNPACRE